MRGDVKMPAVGRELLAEFLLDKRRGLPIEIAIPEWRGIEGVEQLRDYRNVERLPDSLIAPKMRAN